MLFRLDDGMCWVWDGDSVRTLPGHRGPEGFDFPRVWKKREWLLAPGASGLVVGENEIRVDGKTDDGRDWTATNHHRVWLTRLDGVTGEPTIEQAFETHRGAFSPDGKQIALGFRDTNVPGEDLRPTSGSGRPDSASLRRVLRALDDLPRTEVFARTPRPRKILDLPRAELVGWLSDAEILLVENRRLVAFDIATRRRRTSGVWVPDAAHVWIVRE